MMHLNPMKIYFKMLNCEVCKKNRVYVCSDRINAWCQNKCGNYFHDEGFLIYIGKIGFDYPIREDGTIIKIKRTEKENKTIIEEERLIHLEKKIKEILTKRKKEMELYNKCREWFQNLTEDEKIKIYLEKNKED